MEQEQSAPTQQPPAASSLGTRITNVFSSPSELYTEVAGTPVQGSSWSVPFILSIVLAILFTYALFANDVLRQQIYDMQLQGIHKAVEEGKMSEAQFDQVRQRIESSGLGMFMLFGGVSVVIMICVMFFGSALVLWLVSKFGLKSPAGYNKLLEVYGLATFIALLGTIVTLLMMYALGSLHGTPTAALAIMESFDRTNKAHLLLTHVNIFTLWQTAVVGIGLAKVTGKATKTGILIAFGLWIVWAVAASLLGLSFG